MPMPDRAATPLNDRYAGWPDGLAPDDTGRLGLRMDASEASS